MPSVGSEVVVPSVRAESALARRGPDRGERMETPFDMLLEAALPDAPPQPPAEPAAPAAAARRPDEAPPQPARRDCAPTCHHGRDAQITQRPDAAQTAAAETAVADECTDAEACETDAPAGVSGEEASSAEILTMATGIDPGLPLPTDAPAQPAITVSALPAAAVAIPANSTAPVPTSPEVAALGEIQAAPATPAGVPIPTAPSPGADAATTAPSSPATIPPTPTDMRPTVSSPAVPTTPAAPETSAAPAVPLPPEASPPATNGIVLNGAAPNSVAPEQPADMASAAALVDRPEPAPVSRAPAAIDTNEPAPLRTKAVDTSPPPSPPPSRDSQAPINPEPAANVAATEEAARKPNDAVRAAPSAEPAAAPAAQASPERPVATPTPMTNAATADANASAGLTAAASATSTAVSAAPASGGAQVAAAYAAPVPVAGIAVEIVARARDGQNRFEIRLDPPELGRVDVHLRVDRDGNVASRLIVERSETLDLLRRDAPALERALQSAGLKTGEQGLEFSLRDQMPGRDHNDEKAPSRAARVVVADDEVPASAAARNGYGRLIGLGAGIDIRV